MKEKLSAASGARRPCGRGQEVVSVEIALAHGGLASKIKVGLARRGKWWPVPPPLTPP